MRLMRCRRTLDGVLASPRAEAVQQLVRIEHEAAYAGRVAGRIGAKRGNTDSADRRVPTLIQAASLQGVVIAL